VSALAAQTFPLESVEIEGNTRITKDAVIRFSGLRIGEPIDKASIEAACGRLQDTQLFEQISYKYRPGAKRGYEVTLTVSDLGRLTDAAIDLPGIDEAEYWRWMKTISPAFDHKVPGPAQDFLAKQIEQHAGAALNGQHVVARLEQDVGTGRSLLSFQLETMPTVSSVNFEGLKEFTPGELTALLKGAMEVGYTDRTFNRQHATSRHVEIGQVAAGSACELDDDPERDLSDGEGTEARRLLRSLGQAGTEAG
jgi:hypothetical protein